MYLFLQAFPLNSLKSNPVVKNLRLQTTRLHRLVVLLIYKDFLEMKSLFH